MMCSLRIERLLELLLIGWCKAKHVKLAIKNGLLLDELVLEI